MTKAERNAALKYFASAHVFKGNAWDPPSDQPAPPYAVLRYLIEAGYLSADGATLTDKGREMLHALQ